MAQRPHADPHNGAARVVLVHPWTVFLVSRNAIRNEGYNEGNGRPQTEQLI